MTEKKIQAFSELWHLSHDLKDLLTLGFRTDHPQQPDFSQWDNTGFFIRTLEQSVRTCKKCPLYLMRKNALPGTGKTQNPILILAENPQLADDRQSCYWSGETGVYLDKWLASIGLSRVQDCYSTYLVKCKTPGERKAEPQEINSCKNYLDTQIRLIRPKLILCLGETPAQELLHTSEPMNKLRGKMHTLASCALTVTFHPQEVLENPQEMRKLVWEDLQMIQRFLENNPQTINSNVH